MIKLTQIQKLGRRYRRRLFEFWGSERYSKPARQGIDPKLEQYLPSQGFFIEAGANDGFSESNTYYLEKFKGWKGILIEPIPKLYRECVQERSQSLVFNCALVSSDYPDTTVEMTYGHLMSFVKGALASPEAEAKHLEKSQQYYSIKPYEVQVPARTLNSILEQVNVTKIDFLSLDVEGFELNALKGLNFAKYKPQYMLIECLSEKSKKEIEAYISDFYTCVTQLTQYNYLYQLNRYH